MKMNKKVKAYKLPKNAYKLEWKDFKIAIQKFPLELQEKYIKVYNRVTAMRRAKVKERQIPNYSGSSKLSDFQKEYILMMASRFFTPKQMLKVITEEWKIKYSPASLNKFLKINSLDIEQARIRYLSNVSNLRYVHERPRIEELSRIFDEAKDMGNHKLQLLAMREIRHEAKGEGNQTNILVNQSINNTTINNVQKQIIENIDIKLFGEMALIKLINKHKINFLKIAHRLETVLVEKNEETGEEINKVIPVKLEGVGILKDEEERKILKNEEKRFLNNKENVKLLLAKKLKEKTKYLKDMEYEIEEKKEKTNEEE